MFLATFMQWIGFFGHFLCSKFLCFDLINCLTKKIPLCISNELLVRVALLLNFCRREALGSAMSESVFSSFPLTLISVKTRYSLKSLQQAIIMLERKVLQANFLLQGKSTFALMTFLTSYIKLHCSRGHSGMFLGVPKTRKNRYSRTLGQMRSKCSNIRF